MANLASQLYFEIMQMAVPIAVVFELGNLIVGTFMRVAFGGKLWLGK